MASSKSLFNICDDDADWWQHGTLGSVEDLGNIPHDSIRPQRSLSDFEEEVSGDEFRLHHSTKIQRSEPHITNRSSTFTFEGASNTMQLRPSSKILDSDLNQGDSFWEQHTKQPSDQTGIQDLDGIQWNSQSLMMNSENGVAPKIASIGGSCTHSEA